MFQNRSVKNASWIIGCKIVQSLLNLVVGMLTARYLGPTGYGLISYAASVVAFGVPLMNLGFNSILVQEILLKPEEEGSLLGSAIGCSLSSAVACVAGVCVFAVVSDPGSPETILLCCLYSLVLVFQACELLLYWFQAKLLSKYPSLIMLVAYVVVASYKIFLLATGKSIYWFALSNSIDAAIIAGGMLMAYRTLGGKRLAFSIPTARRLLSRSKYYILPALMVVASQQTDKIFLKMFLDEKATGIYTAAVTCVGITSFVYTAIIESAQPAILQTYMENEAAFEQKLTWLYSSVFYLAVAQSLFFSLLAGPIIHILYGADYYGAIPILRLLTWYLPFAHLNTMQHIWILAKEKQQYLWILSVSGMVCGIGLNLVLIPRWGGMGAAFSMLIVQLVKLLVVNYAVRPLRPNLRLVAQGVWPGTLVKMFRELVKK